MCTCIFRCVQHNIPCDPTSEQTLIYAFYTCPLLPTIVNFAVVKAEKNYRHDWLYLLLLCFYKRILNKTLINDH